MSEIERIVDSMEPETALAALMPVIKKIFRHLDEDTRVGFVTGLLETADGDKISSMVNL